MREEFITKTQNQARRFIGDKSISAREVFDLMAKLAEYAAPKLARTVVAGDPDAPLEARCRWVE